MKSWLDKQPKGLQVAILMVIIISLLLLGAWLRAQELRWQLWMIGR